MLPAGRRPPAALWERRLLKPEAQIMPHPGAQRSHRGIRTAAKGSASKRHLIPSGHCFCFAVKWCAGVRGKPSRVPRCAAIKGHAQREPPSRMEELAAMSLAMLPEMGWTTSCKEVGPAHSSPPLTPAPRSSERRAELQPNAPRKPAPLATLVVRWNTSSGSALPKTQA